MQRLIDYVELLGRAQIERTLHIDRTTLIRWLAGTSKPPRSALMVLDMLAGNYPGTDGEWEGWRFAGGRLYAPNGESFHAGDLMAQRYERASLDAMRRENAELKAKIAAMSVSPAVRGKAANDAAIAFVPATQPHR